MFSFHGEIHSNNLLVEEHSDNLTVNQHAMIGVKKLTRYVLISSNVLV